MAEKTGLAWPMKIWRRPRGVQKPSFDLINWLSSKDSKYGVLSEHRNVVNVAINGVLVKDWEKPNDKRTMTRSVFFPRPLAGG